MIQRRTRILAVLLVVAMAAAACGTAAGEGGPETEQAASPFESEFPTLDGASVDLADFEGQDVVLWFWAPW